MFAARFSGFRTVDERSASGVVSCVPRGALQEAADRQHAHLLDLAVARRRRLCLSFPNVYNDARRADAYAALEFPGTYWLAFRDLPEIIARHVTGPVALDFGCGAGRSTRFLKRLGFDATGVDVSASMIEHARISRGLLAAVQCGRIAPDRAAPPARNGG